jgi:hypothetical protein
LAHTLHWQKYIYNHLPMLIKLNPIFPAYARHREKKIEKALTRQQWIYADRVIMLLMFLTVITGAIVFS